MTRNHIRNISAACIWLGSLIAALIILLHIGAGTYSLPAMKAPAIANWFANTDVTIIVLSIGRVLAVVATGYVLITSALCAIAHWTAWHRAAVFLDALTVPAARNIAIRLASVSAISALTIPTAAQAMSSAETPVLRHLLPDEAIPTFTTPTTTATTATTAPETVATPELTTTAPTRQHVVQRGENFWTIAQDTLSSELKRPPTEKEVTTYWRQLVQTNQQQLTNAANPDLIFAGQRLLLPPV